MFNQKNPKRHYAPRIFNAYNKKASFSVCRLIGQCLSFANLSHFLGLLALILSSTNGKRMVLG